MRCCAAFYGMEVHGTAPCCSSGGYLHTFMVGSRFRHLRMPRIRIPPYTWGYDTHGAKPLGILDLALVGNQRIESGPVQIPRPIQPHHLSWVLRLTGICACLTNPTIQCVSPLLTGTTRC
eukprot:3461117-Pyramimonas_sp.AAC.2